MAGARVWIGTIVGAHGIRGALRLKSRTDDPLDIGSYGTVEDEAGGRQFPLLVLGEKKGVVTARIEGVSDRSAAEALKGVKLYVARSALPEPDKDEFYYDDLIGLRADLTDGTVFGTVKAVFEAGAGDILDITRSDGASVLLPFTRMVVPAVDVENGRIVVDPPLETTAEEGRSESDGAGNE